MVTLFGATDYVVKVSFDKQALECKLIFREVLPVFSIYNWAMFKTRKATQLRKKKFKQALLSSVLLQKKLKERKNSSRSMRISQKLRRMRKLNLRYLER